MKRIILAALVLACAFANPAAAQQTTGTISGRLLRIMIPLAESQVAGYTVTTTNASDAEDARVRRERLNSVIASSLARLRK